MSKPITPCCKCADPTPLAILMHAGHQTPMCGPCQLAWFKERDRVVVEAFDNFVKPAKRKAAKP